MIASPGANEAHVVEEYNSEHGENEQINIVYNEGGSEIFISSLQNGTADAGILKEYDGNKYNEQFNANLAISEQPVSGSKANFLYRKGDEVLQQVVDGAVQELIDEGTLKELSIEYLGDDYTQ